MVAITYFTMFIFVVLLLSMSLTAGTQGSYSALAKQWRWLLLVTLWSQVGLLPVMLDMTPEPWKWLAFLGVGAVVFCGGATIFDHKLDWWTHMISAAVAFTALTGWVLVINDKCLLPLIVCMAAGRENWKWRLETGIVISVYMAIIFHLF